ncbi:MAG: DUF1549 and DUF1553 domain-containing protein [Phycisphaerae bacterium]|nr:DUF1549 and DUF1553 domain-containing protein [Phycisphaerae bacterium]
MSCNIRLFFRPMMIFLLGLAVILSVAEGMGAEEKKGDRKKGDNKVDQANKNKKVKKDKSPVMATTPDNPFEIENEPYVPVNQIDTLVIAALKKEGIKPAHLCSDAVFIRRVYLDITGTLPEPQGVRKFIENKKPDKRAILIDRLLASDNYADYWAMKWCDLLRVKAEFPINLWPNAVQAYYRWIHDALDNNMPYDQFARELLTASGSNFRVGQVNFYRAIQGQDPSAIASAVALTFMGVRIDQWPENRRSNMEKFFSRVGYKKTAEWKEEIVYLDPAATGPLETAYPDSEKVKIQPGTDPRAIFARWLIDRDNPWFTRNIVNRQWAWLLGRGIIHEPDDIGVNNPPSHPKLLAYLEKELADAHYDLKHTYRLILNSRTYQQSSIPQSDHPKAGSLFAWYHVRQLDAEVLIDALCWISGTRESYSSAIPEPFTFVPEENRTIKLTDGSITSGFLEMFGRPSRDTGQESERNNNATDAQRLHMLNSSHIQTKIERSWRLNSIMKNAKRKPTLLVNTIYLTILSRYPTRAEMAAVMKYAGTNKSASRQTVNDLA